MSLITASRRTHLVFDYEPLPVSFSFAFCFTRSKFAFSQFSVIFSSTTRPPIYVLPTAPFLFNRSLFSRLLVRPMRQATWPPCGNLQLSVSCIDGPKLVNWTNFEPGTSTSRELVDASNPAVSRDISSSAVFTPAVRLLVVCGSSDGKGNGGDSSAASSKQHSTPQCCNNVSFK